MNHTDSLGKKSIVVLIILLFVSFLLMGISQSKITIKMKSVAYGVFYPFQFVGTGSITLVTEFFSSIKNNRQLKEELAAARKLIEQYERTQYDFEEIRRENERLRNLIGVQSTLEFDTVIAEIVAKSPQNFYRTLIVNRGRDDGIQRWMPVVAYQDEEKCVVGKIIDVQKFSSRIQPMIEQSSYTAAMLKDSRYSGILQGQSPTSDLCLLQYIDRRADVKYGDVVVTSGMGGVFPKGIVLGTVVSVSKKQYGIFQEAYVQPVIDYGRLEEVYIITKVVTGEFLNLLEEER